MNTKFGKRKNKLLKWIKIIIMIYVLIGVALYFFQDKLLFHPKALPVNYAFHFNTPFTEINVPYDSSTSFNIIRFKLLNDSLKKGAVVYCHCNMENVNHYAMFVNNF